MTITLRNTKGSPLSFEEMDENFSDLNNRMGHWDYNDSTTPGTPIQLSTTPTYLTNDGLGTFSTNTYALSGVPQIWNTSTNRFDFTSLDNGDTVDVRFDLTITTGGNNREIIIDFDLGIGAGNYQLPVTRESSFQANTFQSVRFTTLYLGDDNTRLNPAGIRATSSNSTGDSIVVNGWFVRVRKWRS